VVSDEINGDLSVRAVADTEQMAWTPSPSGTVWRKRVHLVGPAEAGQVTSVVRYEPNASFPQHDHPDGEEILVLDGVFSDEQGDWPRGTYLLNPEGFRHAPRSGPGCRLFVKLRQFPGRERAHVALDTNGLPWVPTERAGVWEKLLYRQPGYSDVTRLLRWDADAAPAELVYPEGAELFVLSGEFSDEEGDYAVHTWLRLPPGTRHRVRTAAGCTLYTKLGGFAYLAAGAAG
jgi:anti-sigma factor ChrR (cupin superfamily)